jgi:hypothetical protein
MALARRRVMRFSWKAFGLVACVVASGCSGSTSSGGPNCSSFNACGGNIVGTWKVTGECIGSQYNPFAAQCPSSTFSESASVSGTLTFETNGMYTITDMGMASGSLSIPSSCLTPGGITTCDQLQADFNGDGGTGTMATCSTTSTGCSCQLHANQATTTTNGTYTTSGSSLTLTSNGTSGTSPYCVQGSGLLIQTIPGMMGSSNSITVAATKQ